LISNTPDVVHFHHIAGSNGITAEHVRIASTLNVKIIFTAHLVGQTCFTGNQLFCGKYNCDGTIKLIKCTFCFNYSKKLGLLSTILTIFSFLLSKLNLNIKSQNKLFTALNISNQIKKKKQDFQTIIDSSHVIIAISKWYYDTLLLNNVSPEKLKFIPQSLPKFPNECQINLNIQNKSRPLNILYIGRITSEKGLHILLDALFTLNCDDYRLDIYGPTADIKYEQDLKYKSKGYGNINWKGTLVHDEIIKVMINYDLLCMCSIITEMSPLIIQESFAAGLPVLASNVPGNKEVISDEVNGLLFKNGSKENLREQLKRCFLNSSILTDIRNNIRISNDSRDLAISYDSIYKSQL
jgi:glycosyltransferase involved in cell wall biosynthesis